MSVTPFRVGYERCSKTSIISPTVSWTEHDMYHPLHLECRAFQILRGRKFHNWVPMTWGIALLNKNGLKNRTIAVKRTRVPLHQYFCERMHIFSTRTLPSWATVIILAPGKLMRVAWDDSTMQRMEEQGRFQTMAWGWRPFLTCKLCSTPSLPR